MIVAAVIKEHLVQLNWSKNGFDICSNVAPFLFHHHFNTHRIAPHLSLTLVYMSSILPQIELNFRYSVLPATCVSVKQELKLFHNF